MPGIAVKGTIAKASANVKILWVCPTFLHPTTRGGQIRTLGMLKDLHRSHEIHFAALHRPEDGTEGVDRSSEYSTRSYAIPHHPPDAGTPGFFLQAFAGLFSGMPLAVRRWRSPALRDCVGELLAQQRFDRVVCDFLAAAPNIPHIERAVLFQHNVETVIWERSRDQAKNSLKKLVFRYEAARMFNYESAQCRAAGCVIAVSEEDAERMRDRFGIARAAAVPTGVDLEYFTPPASPEPVADLAFIGSMNWTPNIDGVLYFCEEILPLIQARFPACRVAIAGRTPPPSITALPGKFANVSVTGSVPDIRPYFWGSKICIVPLRIGGGTRLKIYEAMAARIPVVSTSVGAEGLPLEDGKHIVLGDNPKRFSDACIDLLSNEAKRRFIADHAWNLVASQFSWKHAADCFEKLLKDAPSP